MEHLQRMFDLEPGDLGDHFTEIDIVVHDRFPDGAGEDVKTELIEFLEVFYLFVEF